MRAINHRTMDVVFLLWSHSSDMEPSKRAVHRYSFSSLSRSHRFQFLDRQFNSSDTSHAEMGRWRSLRTRTANRTGSWRSSATGSKSDQRTDPLAAWHYTSSNPGKDEQHLPPGTMSAALTSLSVCLILTRTRASSARSIFVRDLSLSISSDHSTLLHSDRFKSLKLSKNISANRRLPNGNWSVEQWRSMPLLFILSFPLTALFLSACFHPIDSVRPFLPPPPPPPRIGIEATVLRAFRLTTIRGGFPMPTIEQKSERIATTAFCVYCMLSCCSSLSLLCCSTAASVIFFFFSTFPCHSGLSLMVCSSSCSSSFV